MDPLAFKKLSLDDLDSLRSLGIRTFRDAFGDVNSEMNMNQYVESSFNKERLASELTDSEVDYYFIEMNQAPVGYLKLNRGNAQTERQDPKALEIERLYVVKSHQGMRLGSKLLDKALEVAQSYRAPYVWLGVWEHNTGARRLYDRYGFVEFDKHVFRLGNDDQTDILMKLHLY